MANTGSLRLVGPPSVVRNTAQMLSNICPLLAPHAVSKATVVPDSEGGLTVKQFYYFVGETKTEKAGSPPHTGLFAAVKQIAK